MQRSLRVLALVLSLGLLLVSWSTNIYAQPNVEEPVVQSDFGATNVAWSVPQGSGSFILVVAGPNGYRFERTFQSGASMAFQAVDASGAPLADGLYVYELTQVQFDATNKTRAIGDDGRDAALYRELAQSQVNPSVTLAPVSGAFTIQNGTILDPNAAEEQTQATAQTQQGDSPAEVDAPLDQVIADDLIVQGSICTGFDCVNNENFGADTIRLKENNLRIHFDDTSSTGSFPNNDWRITANDQASGGANYLSIDDVTGARVPFKLTAGAPTNSFFMDSSGRVGLGTATPVLNVHIASGNTPATRLEQNGTSGFTAQTWDIAGNEANFFIRDITNGSQLPFKIQPGADTNSLTIESTNDVGVGTLSPSASLHVRRTDGTAQVLVEEASGTSAQRNLIKLLNANGNVALQFVRTDLDPDSDWKVGVRAAGFEINEASDGNAEFFLTSDGSLAIQGTLTTAGPTCSGGCRQQRDLFVKSASLLDKLSDVPMLQWSKSTVLSDDPDHPKSVTTFHLSPEMESFYEIYGLGLDGQSIAPLDVAAVALGSVQALKETVDAQNVQIAALEAQLAEMEVRMQRLEEMAHTHTYLPSVSTAP